MTEMTRMKTCYIIINDNSKKICFNRKVIYQVTPNPVYMIWFVTADGADLWKLTIRLMIEVSGMKNNLNAR